MQLYDSHYVAAYTKGTLLTSEGIGHECRVKGPCFLHFSFTLYILWQPNILSCPSLGRNIDLPNVNLELEIDKISILGFASFLYAGRHRWTVPLARRGGFIILHAGSLF